MKQLSFSYTALSKLLRRRLTTTDGSRAAHMAWGGVYGAATGAALAAFRFYCWLNHSRIL